MKKIIAIMLILTSAFLLFSCGGDDPIESINKMYDAIAPTKIITTATTVIGKQTLTAESQFVTGYVGGKIASTYTYSSMSLRDVDSGPVSDILPYYIVNSGKSEYLENKGLREWKYIDGTADESFKQNGKWQSTGEDFTPENGDIAINLKKSALTNVVADAEKKTVSFTVPKDNVADVFDFGEDVTVDADVLVVITHDGGAITGIVISYTVPGAKKGYPDTVVTIKSNYYYDPETVTID
jgi:hypothetical protein